MKPETVIKKFEEQNIRAIFVAGEDKWYFSVVDVLGILTSSSDPRNYWKVTKHNLIKEGHSVSCRQMKLAAQDDKQRLTDVMEAQQIVELLKVITSPKAIPFKIWMIRLGRKKLNDTQMIMSLIQAV